MTDRRASRRSTRRTSGRTTRRAALGLMATGGILLATETSGVTSLDADRTLDVDATGDADALLGVEGPMAAGEDAPESVPNPTALAVTNRFGSTVEVTVDAEDLEFEDVDSAGAERTLDPGVTAPITVYAPADGDVTDDIHITVTGADAGLEFSRSLTLEDVDREVWYTGRDDGTVELDDDGDDGDDDGDSDDEIVSSWSEKLGDTARTLDVIDGDGPTYTSFTGTGNGPSAIGFSEDDGTLGTEDSTAVVDANGDVTAFLVVDPTAERIGVPMALTGLDADGTAIDPAAFEVIIDAAGTASVNLETIEVTAAVDPPTAPVVYTIQVSQSGDGLVEASDGLSIALRAHADGEFHDDDDKAEDTGSIPDHVLTLGGRRTGLESVDDRFVGDMGAMVCYSRALDRDAIESLERSFGRVWPVALDDSAFET